MVQKRCQFCLKMLQKVPKASKTETVQAGTVQCASAKSSSNHQITCSKIHLEREFNLFYVKQTVGSEVAQKGHQKQYKYSF